MVNHPPESKLGSPIGFGSISLIVIGVVMIIIGMIFLIIYQNQDKPWWVWTLLIVGIAFGLLGAIILVFWLSYKPDTSDLCYTKKIIDTSDQYPPEQSTILPNTSYSKRYYGQESLY